MQDRYVGDVGDFGKYGLLRWLCGARHADDQPPLRLGILWYLVPDESQVNDGKHTGYLDKPDTYRDCDPDLFDALFRIVKGRTRSVREVEAARLFPEDTVFYDTVLTYDTIRRKDERLAQRENWLKGGLSETKACDIVFLDPDNGLEVPSAPKHTKRAPKYAYYDEVRQFADRGQSLVIYHHLCRQGTTAEQVYARVKDLHERSTVENVLPLILRRGTARAFFILPTPSHTSVIQSRLDAMKNHPWMIRQHFDLL